MIGTTLRLWLRRRVLRRVPRWSSMPPSRRRAVGAVVSVAVIVLAGLIGALATTRRGGAPGGGQPKNDSGPGTSSAVLAAAGSNRQRAGAWIATQVGHSAIVGCDPVMCTVLAQDGFPGSDLLPLGPTSTDPMGAAVVVATAAVRSQFGSKLTGVYAPAVLADFGTGTASVQVRVMAPDGAAAYQHAMAADLAARRADGRQLLHAARLRVSGPVRAELAAGLVDSRLLSTLVNLAASYRVTVVTFGSPQPGASPGIPLRFMEVVLPARKSAAASVAAGALGIVRQQIPPYTPASVQTGHTVAGPSLRIEFAAPSPPGLLHQSAAGPAHSKR